MSGSERQVWPASERRGKRASDRRGKGASERPGKGASERPGKGASERPGKKDRRSRPDRRDEAAWIAVPLEAGSDETALIEAARRARLHARAEYSGFKVGAAIELQDGSIVTGCNIENASYGLTICAERVALLKALSDGHETFTRIAVVADTVSPTPPCGPCRQLLWEYCGDIEVILANLDGPAGRHRMSALLPLPFDQRLLK